MREWEEIALREEDTGWLGEARHTAGEEVDCIGHGEGLRIALEEARHRVEGDGALRKGREVGYILGEGGIVDNILALGAEEAAAPGIVDILGTEGARSLHIAGLGGDIGRAEVDRTGPGPVEGTARSALGRVVEGADSTVPVGRSLVEEAL